MPSNKMHKDELPIDELLVKSLVQEQCPSFSGLNIEQVKHSGTDNAIFKLGNDKAIRLPRIKSAAQQIEKELQWLPIIAPSLPIAIPVPIENGVPSDKYPFSWYIYDWIEGKNALQCKPNNLKQVAIDLANFIRSLQNIKIDGAPTTRRGFSLETQHYAFQSSIAKLDSTYDTKTVQSVWQECLAAPQWSKPSVWLHGDLLPSNLLVKDDKLTAIIDFGLSGIGDPACDLILAWSLFDASSRKVFRKELNVDDETWLRGKGWALSIAVIIIPYYIDTNQDLVSIAQTMIRNILEG